MSGLTDRQKAILAMEKLWWAYAGAKEQAIQEQFDVSATRYYSELNHLLQLEAALAHDPLTVRRLRRIRAQRQRSRSVRDLEVEA